MKGIMQVIGSVTIVAVLWLTQKAVVMGPTHIEKEKIDSKSIFPTYSSTITQKDGNFYIVNNASSTLVLVNKQRRLPDGYAPQDLIIPNVRFSYAGNREKMKLRREAAVALEKLFQKAESEQVYLFAVSAYRSHERQRALYESYEQTEGKEVTALYSAFPGTSEHETGLAVDVSSKSIGFQLDTSFEQTKEGIWLREHANEFGYIIRYPKDKTNRTGYSYEPWHIRYIGVEYAKQLYEKGQTLEEAMPNQ